MRKTIEVHTCDRCEHRFGSPRDVAAKLVISMPTVTNGTRTIELCWTCANAFNKFCLEEPTPQENAAVHTRSGQAAR